MTAYNIVATTNESTVVAEYTPVGSGIAKYQSEDELEKEFIKILQNNGYEYINIKNSSDLINNLRQQLAKLNNYKFSDAEWEQIMSNYIANKKDSIEEKTAKVQDDDIYPLRCDDGQLKNIHILDKENIHNNHLQVINQYETDTGTHSNRYDVSVLVNGLPLVHIELKRRGVAIREAFNQINRYQRDSFWADSGLFEFVQLFVISNGTNTKYYSNTTRDACIKEKKKKKIGKKTSNSFEFTSWWTDGKNKRISDLVDFAKTFFSKHTLLSIITRYCVFTTEKMLLVMRPYQIVAAELILRRIVMATNHKQTGTIDAGGYIWHTTGSGKTLTSFKTAQLASKLFEIDKVLFVVDRKDLDYQTMKEYDKFKEGSANSNTSTAILTQQLADSNAKIIITTIQKLDKFISKNKSNSIFDKHIVIIFDECHRSQFGDMHKRIIKNFKNYHIFGFTGTPIFEVNAASELKTTEQAFGQKLHAYTIVDAITDENVLRFLVDYIETVKMKDDVKDKQVHAIDKEKAINAPERISKIVAYILEHFDQKTYRNKGVFFQHKVIENVKEVASNKYRKVKEVIAHKNISGFNSIFAVSSIETAKKYYAEFVKQQKELPETKRLKIALIYSFGANEAESMDDFLPDEDFDTNNLDKSSRDFLDEAIKDYNTIFKTNWDTSSDKFESYYKDLSMQVKNCEIDLLLVVNMFLTGFDATTLNTLWVDKNLRYHGLLQAFSRTNRILNSTKAFGNIICFRDLNDATNEAISIFGNKEAGGIVLLKSYSDYYNGWDKDGEHNKGYVELIAEIREKFPLSKQIIGEQAEKDFIHLYGDILKVKNILSSFDDFESNEILSERDFQDYQSSYLDLYDKLRRNKDGIKEFINDDLIFEIELIKQVTYDIDYILLLVTEYYNSRMHDKEIRITIDKAMSASFELRSKKELIERFINTLNTSNTNTDIDRDWHIFAKENKKQDLDKIIEEENLKSEQAREYIDRAFDNGELKVIGTTFADILPPVSYFAESNDRAKKKFSVLEKLKAFFEKYWGI
jgi:type I restriction enzyme R subunit